MKLTDRFVKARGRFSGHHPNVLMLLLSVLMLKHINTPEKILAVTFPVFVNACKTVQALKYSHQAIFSFAETSKNLV